MGMTIDDSIMELEILKKNTFSYMSAHQAFITAIETMRKYQQLQADYETRLKADEVIRQKINSLKENSDVC